MKRVVILAAGDFPRRGSEGERLLKSATYVIACDSAADGYRRRFRRWPDAVVGDLDSVSASSRRPPSGRCRVVRDADQDTNDLAKALAFARREGVLSPESDLVIVGATGGREDHTIGNVFRALEAGVRVVTEAGEFLPVNGRVGFKTWKNAGVSVFAVDPGAKMTSKGLSWPLEGVRFANPYCATLNRASSPHVTVTSDRAAFVFVERNVKAVRAVVALGSNLGDRAAYLRRSLAALAALPETRLVDASEVIETEGVDVPAAFASLRFLNQVALFETTLAPFAFSRAMHAIEDRLGRVRTVRNGPRTIDLDLIAFGNVRLLGEELTLPHPRARERKFVTSPMRSLGLSLGK